MDPRYAAYYQNVGMVQQPKKGPGRPKKSESVPQFQNYGYGGGIIAPVGMPVYQGVPGGQYSAPVAQQVSPSHHGGSGPVPMAQPVPHTESRSPDLSRDDLRRDDLRRDDLRRDDLRRYDSGYSRDGYSEYSGYSRDGYSKSDRELMDEFGITEVELVSLEKQGGGGLISLTAEQKMYMALLFAVLCMVFAGVVVSKRVWSEEGASTPPDHKYTPPDLDEDDLIDNAQGSEALGLFTVVSVGLSTIVLGIYTIYAIIKNGLRRPSAWVFLFLLVYFATVFVVIEMERSTSYIGGAHGSLERMLISLVFGVLAMAITLVGLKLFAPSISFITNWTYPLLSLVLGMNLTHLIYHEKWVASLIDEYIVGSHKDFIVPVFILAVFIGPLFFSTFRSSSAAIPWVITSFAVALIYYLMALVHTRFGKFRGVANLGVRDSNDPCAECDIFHQFILSQDTRVHQYAQAVCDSNATPIDREKIRGPLLSTFDVVAAGNPTCKAFCQRSKDSLRRLKCKCERGEDGMCGSVADLQLYKEFKEYDETVDFLDGNWGLGKPVIEGIVVLGVGVGLVFLLNWTETFQDLLHRFMNRNLPAEGTEARLRHDLTEGSWWSRFTAALGHFVDLMGGHADYDVR